LNFSVLDGWWPEACQHGVNGWQIGNGFESEDFEILDENDINSLYETLCNEILPTYYDNRPKWVDMMQNSIKSTSYQFSMERMLKEYLLQKLYPGRLNFQEAARWLGDEQTIEELKSGENTASIERRWEAEIEKFQAVRRRHLLY
jgi:glucan phosphorylase